MNYVGTWRAHKLWVLVVLMIVGAPDRSQALSCGDDFDLHSVGSTGIQIAIAWEPVPNAVSYTIKRAADCSTSADPGSIYTVSSHTTTFGDTGKPPDARDHFFLGKRSTCTGGASAKQACSSNNDCLGGACVGQCAYGPSFGQACQCPAPNDLPCMDTITCAGSLCTAGLEVNETYCYVVRAALPDASERVSTCLPGQQLLSPAAPRPRGVDGDLWADVVLGKSDFGENGFGKVHAYTSYNAGGVALDESVQPARLYLMDSGRNRVLVFDHIGTCSVSGAECTTHGDCSPNEACVVGDPVSQGVCQSSSLVCTEDADCPTCSDEGCCQYEPTAPAPVAAIGQVDLVDFGACNMDATFQAYPERRDASAQSLCMLDPSEISPAEAGVGTMMAIGEGNVYIADRFNHRVVRFADPAGQMPPNSGEVAENVWGQSDFSENLPNRGSTSAGPDCMSFSLAERKNPGVALDWDGNMWVADVGNHRVVRFPLCSGDARFSPICTGVPEGEIAAGADLVLGQVAAPGSGTGPCQLAEQRPLNWGAAPNQALDKYLFPVDIAFNRPLCAGGPNDGTPCVSDADCGEHACPRLLFVADSASADHEVGGIGPAESRILVVDLSNLEVHDSCSALPDALARTTAISFQDELDEDPLQPGYCFGYGDDVIEAMINPSHPLYPLALGNRALQIEFDTQTNGIWVQMFCPEGNSNIELLDLDATPPQVALRVAGRTRYDAQILNREVHGFTVDSQGDLLVTVKTQGLFRVDRNILEANGLGPLPGGPHESGAGAFQLLFLDVDLVPSSRTVVDTPRGVTVYGDQIVQADSDRLMVWNGFDPYTFTVAGEPLLSGHPASLAFRLDGLVGLAAPNEGPRPFFTYPKSITRVTGEEQLWVYTRDPRQLLRFSGTLTSTSSPTSFPLPDSGNSVTGFCTCETCDASISLLDADEHDFDVQVAGDDVNVWFADRFHHRVFRVRDFEDPQARCVDVILGQPDALSVSCNQGRDVDQPSGDSLCAPYNVSVDDASNVYVSDNGFEVGSNNRVLQWDASAFESFPSPQCTTVPCFAPPAHRVFGTGGLFTVNGDPGAAPDPFRANSDPMIGPYGLGFGKEGRFVLTNNPFPFGSARFPLVYMNPLAEKLPQLALGDFLSNPRYSPFFDVAGNLFVPDANNGRTVVYRRPLHRAEVSTRTPTPTPTHTLTPTHSPTITPTLVECPGDCVEDNIITVDEIITLISIAIGVTDITACPAGDVSGDGAVTVDDIVRALTAALQGCPLVLGPPPNHTSHLQILPIVGLRGGTYPFMVQLIGGGGVVAAINLDIRYPVNVLQDVSCVLDDSVSSILPATMRLHTATIGEGQYRVMLLDSTLDDDEELPPSLPSLPDVPDGVLLNCEGAIKSTAPFGEHRTQATRANTCTDTGQSLSSSAGMFVVNVINPDSPPPSGDCHIGTPTKEGRWTALLFLIPLVLAWVGRRRRQFAAALLICGLLIVPAATHANEFGLGGTWAIDELRSDAEAEPSIRALSQHRDAGQRDGFWHVWNVRGHGTDSWIGSIAITGMACMQTGSFEAKHEPGGIVVTLKNHSGRQCGALLAKEVATDKEIAASPSRIEVRGKIAPALVDESVSGNAPLQRRTRQGYFRLGVTDVAIVEEFLRTQLRK